MVRISSQLAPWLLAAFWCFGLFGCTGEHAGQSSTDVSQREVLENQDSPGMPHGFTFADSARQNMSIPVTGDSLPDGRGGQVELTMTDEGLVVTFWFEDTDILADGDADQLPHYKLGDVCEIFLAPPDTQHYWELFLSPKGYQTSVFWLRRGEPDSDKGGAHRIPLRAKVSVDGTINITTDVDRGWGAVVLLPRTALSAAGDPPITEGGWRILIARQDYAGQVGPDHRMLSSFPALSRVDFHTKTEYAQLIVNESTKQIDTLVSVDDFFYKQGR